MRITSLLNHVRQSSPYAKLILLVTASGGLVAYSESKADHIAHTAKSSQIDAQKKTVVVLGTGWAGTSFLKNLDSSQYDVRVVSPLNYFAFTPLLPSVTCGTVEARSIVEPIRKIINKKNKDIHFLEAECIKIDAANKKVICRGSQDLNLEGNVEFHINYDILVIGLGAQSNTFNTPGVNEHCHFLKEIDDAQKIRRSIMDCFEKASLPCLSDEEKKTALHFLIVGGGPTGVEFAAELHDFVSEDLVNLYPTLKDHAKISIIQSGDHILNTFDERISSFAERKFQRDGIEVKTGSRVLSVSDNTVIVKDKANGVVSALPYGMVVWATGIGPRPVVTDFMSQIGQKHRRMLATDEWLRVEGCNDVYALGDCASIHQRKVMEDISAIFDVADKDKSGTLTVKELEDVLEDINERYPQVELYLRSKHVSDLRQLLNDCKGDDKREIREVDIEGFKAALSHVDSQMKSLPATAQVAAQQGEYLAKCFNHKKECEDHPEGPLRFTKSGRHRFHPFRYKHFGQFAPLGGEQTAAELPGDWVSVGYSSQWLWYSVYASKQVSWRTRMLVISDWTRRFVFGRDSSRI